LLYKTVFSLLLVVVLLFTSCGKGKKVKPNILLITIDTLRRDHLGVYGYPRNTSPFIDELARSGVRFKHAITPIPSTAPSHASILTSLHPLTHGVTTNAAYLTPKVQTIAEVLKNNGYYTIGAVAVKILAKKYHFSQGFDSFSDIWDKKTKFNRLFYRGAKSVNESLFNQIDTYLSNHNYQEKPLFIWVHYFDPHFPYEEREDITFKNELQDRKNNNWIKRYDKEIRYTDSHIKELYNYLGKKGITRRLVTCITADHGEHFFEHGLTYSHGDFYSETTFVPLIFHGYCIPKHIVIDTYVSTLDIAVTLLSFANLSFDYPSEGINLLEWTRKPVLRRDRKLLVIGNPQSAKSLQLIGYPFDYILNFDCHYQNWFIAGDTVIPIDKGRFKPLNEKRIKIKENTLQVFFPQVFKKGLSYAVFQADIKKNTGLFVQIKMLPYSFTKKIEISKTLNHLTIIYPVTILDRIIFNLELNKGTSLDNFSYAVILKKEFTDSIVLERKIDNKIFKELVSLRKKKNCDEFFNLINDVQMESNLVETRKFKSTILEYKELIYGVVEYYHKKKKALLKGTTINEKLTGEKKKMLKSLGYLEVGVLEKQNNGMLGKEGGEKKEQ
jgi:arylsulfatase A-like enzyme